MNDLLPLFSASRRSGLKRWQASSTTRWTLAAVSLLLCALIGSPALANVTVNAAATAAQIQTLLQGTGVTIGTVTVTGAGAQWGSFTNGTVNSGGPTDPTVNIDTGLIMSTGNAAAAPGPNNTNASTDAGGTAPADADLVSLQANAGNDTITVEFDITADDDFIEFNFAFASEEYNEYVCSNFNDAMGIFVRDLGGPFSGGGVNAAVAPQSNDIISINTINNSMVGSQGTAGNCISLGNSALYKDNPGGANFVYDGITANISKFVPVVAGVTYTVKLVLADAGDSSFDSAVFFSPINSATTHALITAFEVDPDGSVYWSTSSQIGSLGFDLEEWNGDFWARVNELPLPARPDAPQGADYRYSPPRALGAGPFRIIETEVGGVERVLGPFSSALESPRGVARSARRGPRDGSTFSSTARLDRTGQQARRDSARVERQAAQTSLTDARRSFGAREFASSPASFRTSQAQASVVVLQGVSPGLVRLPSGEIASAFGLSQSAAEERISTGDVRIESYGEQVAWTPVGPDLVFVAEEPPTNFAASRTYIVSLAAGTQMSADAGGLPAALAAPSEFTASAEFEVQDFAATVVTSDPLSDFWFWAAFAAGNPSFDTRQFDVDLPGLIPGTSSVLALTLFGTTDPIQGNDHQMSVSANAQLLGSHSWNGVGESTAQLAVGANVLTDGINTIELTADLLPQVASSFPYLDSMRVTYQRSAKATAGTLEATAGGSTTFTAEGFGDSGVLVVRTSTPQPRLVSGVNVEFEAGRYRASFDAVQGEVYSLADSTGLQSASLTVKTPLSLPVPQVGAELVLIAPPVLHQAAQDYANVRASQGVDAAVVDTEAIWLAYADGDRDPRAIRAFLSDAWANWGNPPKYALILGHGNYDYRDFLAGGDNLVPPLLVSTTGGLYSSDMTLGDVVGSDGLPEIVVGRLPVLSGSEVDSYLDKLSDSRVPGQNRWNHVALVGDNRDMAGPFDANVSDLGLLLPTSTTQQQILLDELPLAQARQELQTAFSDGAQILTYVGHGGLDQFAQEGLLTSADVDLLTSSGQLPVVVSLTCSVGRFEVPGFTSLAESLALDTDAGATAVWAPSGVSFNTSANLLGRFFMEAAVEPGTETLGDAVQGALEQYDNFGSLEELALIYNLIGDPSIELWTDQLIEPPVVLPSLLFETGFETSTPAFGTLIVPRP